MLGAHGQADRRKIGVDLHRIDEGRNVFSESMAAILANRLRTIQRVVASKASFLFGSERLILQTQEKKGQSEGG
jgi:hypothetical protein